MNRKSYSLFLILFFALSAGKIFSATFYCRANGNWATASTWSVVSCSGASAASIPGAGDAVVICAGRTVTMNGNPGACLSLIVNGTANWTSAFTTNVGAGGLTLNTGAVLSGTAVGTLNVAGTLTQSGTATIGGITLAVTGATSVSGTMTFNNAGGTKTFSSVTINAPGDFSSSVAETYAVSGNLVMNGGSLTGSSSGIMTVGGTFTIMAGTSAALGNMNLSVTGLTSINGALTDNSTGGSNVFNNVDLNSTGSFNNTAAETYTINGNLSTYGGDFIATGATPVFNIAGNFNVVSGVCDVSRIKFTIGGTTTIAGTLDINSVRGTKTFNNIVVTSTGTFNSTVAENYAVNGNIQVDGTFNANSGVWTLSGSGKTISGTTAITFDDITDNGSYTNSASVTLGTSLGGTGTWSQAATGTVNLPISNANFSVNIFNASAAGNTVIYSRAGNQTVIAPNDGSYSNLTLSNSGTKQLAAATVVGKNVLISGSAAFDSNNKNLTVGGNFTNNSTFTPGTATVTLNGSSAQTLGGTSVTGFNNLTVNNAAGITLGNSITVGGALAFTSGVITTSANKVTINSGGSVSGAGTSKFVNGFLEKAVSIGSSVSRTFEVGSGTTDYLPLTLLFGTVSSVAGKITVKVNNGDHPNIGTSVIDDLKSVNRYWSITNSGTTFTNYTATCNFIGVPSDADAGSITANYYMAIYNAGAWTLLTRGTVAATSNQATGVTTVGDLQIGEKRQSSVVITASPSGTVCAGTNVTFTATPTNGGTTPTYQWKKNGVNIGGATASTYSTTTLVTGDVITCLMTSSLVGVLGSPSLSNSITMTVTPSVPVSVSIAVSPSPTICAGASVTFTATPTNGGTVPFYQWQVNGSNVGTNSPTYTSSTLTNGQIVTCILTSNVTCPSGNPATSNAITMTVNPVLPVSISISASPSSTVCAGTNVTFTATPTNGGATPAYQWKKNAVNIGGATASTYSSSALVTGDVITCQLTSSATCISGSPATSNAITMTVNPNLPVSVSISASPSSTICSGTNVTFTATPTNGGGAPVYQWKKNAVNIGGATSSTYSTTTLVNGDVITCQLTSSATCITGSPATSNSITITVNPNLPVSVTIAASPSSTICAGTSVTFTATPTNGGTVPSYQWQVNGSNVGTNSPTYTSSALTNGQIVTCILTSNVTCPSGNPATSNAITMTVNPIVTASVTIAASPSGTICSGTSVTFTATPVNGGAAPVYQWKLNGSSVGINSPTYTNASLASGDAITCVMTSNAACVVTATVNSNTINMTVTAPGTWLGTVSNNWNAAGNWCGGVPTSTTDVTIPAGASFYPQLTANASCRGININAGGSFSLSSFNINVKGNWVNNGTFNQGTGTVVFDGAAAQTILTAGTMSFNNLTINNAAGVMLAGGSYSLDGALTCSAGTFNTNGKSFTMTSTAARTARIAPITGTGAITGDFTVQRFLSARDTTFCDLASPVAGTNFDDWNAELPAISYSYSPPYNEPSAYTYDETGDVYVPITSSATALTSGKGYEIFVAGDFSYSGLPNTTLNLTGIPAQGTRNLSAFISNNAQGWNLVGNPFASSISWASVYAASGAASSGLYDYIEMYDYTIADWNGYTSADGIEIGSGQGFWVYGLPGATGLTLIIPESSKTSSSNSSIKTMTNGQYLSLQLSGDQHSFAHTFRVRVLPDALNGIDALDIPFRKSPNLATPQLYSVVEGRKINTNSFNGSDDNYTIPLESKATYSGHYSLDVSGVRNISRYACISLEDKFLGKTIDLTAVSRYEFDMDTADRADRFALHFSKTGDCKATQAQQNAEGNQFVEVLPSAAGSHINFSFNESTPVTVEVMNTLGQSIVPELETTAGYSSQEIRLPDDYSGLYIVRITSAKGVVVKKLYRN
ncbi:MAG: T9SS type A sorting domain-containing protein [Bacteroidia bacterium]